MFVALIQLRTHCFTLKSVRNDKGRSTVRKSCVIPECSPFSVHLGQIQVQVSSKAWMTLSYAGGGVCEGRKPLSPLLPNQKECLLLGTRDAESDEFDAAVSSGMRVSSPISRPALLLLGTGRKVEVSTPGLLPRGPTGSREGCLYTLRKVLL